MSKGAPGYTCSVFRQLSDSCSIRAFKNRRIASAVAAQLTRLPQIMRSGAPAAKAIPYTRALRRMRTVICTNAIQAHTEQARKILGGRESAKLVTCPEYEAAA